MVSQTVMALLSLAMLVAMWVSYEIGRWQGERELRRDPDRLKAGGGATEAGVLGLLGLLLAFAFAGAAGRLDTRRAQIAEEANAIGTAWLRLELLDQSAQPKLRDLFRQYVDARIQMARAMPDRNAAMEALRRGNQLQNQIWSECVAAAREAPDARSASVLLLPALNDMIDITTTRSESTKFHLPPLITGLLLVIALLATMLVGYTAADKPRRIFHTFIFIAAICVTIFVILDLEYPRAGLIRLDDFDQVIVDLRQSMN